MKFNLRFLFIALFICTISIAQNKGTISGVLTDKETNNAALPFANVLIKGTNISVNTDIDGKYSLNVNPGNYTIVFSFVGYETKEAPVTVKAGETVTVNQVLSSGSFTLKDVVVKSTASKEKETALLLEQKNAVVIKQSIGAQEMSRKGVSDVEEGLTKITGITKVDGRGLFVRGLEDRYNSLLLNDLAVPSNNPFKKIIPLDIFPTDIVSVLETYKTFNTNLYGDFAGATFNIITTATGKSQTKINFGAGYTINNNLKKFLISQDATSTSDFFGFSGNERDLPSAINKNPSFQTLTADQAANGFGSGFDVKSDVSPLNTSFGITHSEKFNIGKNQNVFQYLLSLNYDNKYQIRTGADRFFNPGQGNYINDLVTTQYKFITNSSALAALTYKTNRFSLTSNTTYLRSTENSIQDQLGYTNSNVNQPNGFIRMNQLQESTFFNTQLFGNYKITEDGRHSIKSGVSYSTTQYELPDRKSFSGIKIDDNTTSISYSGNSIVRQYLDFKGDEHISGLLEYSWKFGNEDISKSHKLTTGYNGYMNKMGSEYRFLVSQRLNSNSITFPTNTPDAILRDEILNNNFTYNDGTNPTYKAMLEEFVNAGYLDLAFKFSEKIELNVGVRAEQTHRETEYKDAGSFEDPYKTITVDKTDFLPSLNAKYILNPNSNVRFAASKTITRPVIMESYPLEFVNPDGTIEQGNPLLINSDNYNFDLKYELFPTNKELISATIFTKIIENPIERLFTNSAGSGGQIMTYGNSKQAFLYGAEFEFLFQLERISKSLSNFSFGANASLMDSKVTIEKVFKNGVNNPETIAEDADPTRKLQGASPWIVNADLRYDSEFSEKWKSSMTMVYNLYSKRIYAVGTNKLDNYYEMPFGKLDFIWQNKISDKFDVKLSVDNLLNPAYKIEMGEKSRLEITESDLTVREYKKGVGFSMNISYTF
ncbi:TonB-dependent receptor [Flavobacterium sp. CF108]|uniref:TonB-dependent receptor n=1 Tax=unclassified Flavobacterium TaxID=196869 RepID=UPI0008D39757|nr:MULTISPECIES: TonB-dependent receptor [unclassified Flavobacterium]SEP16670.1 TonB-dependent receptor [Flavobacterium sp. fv08]SHH46220.1 TonB-dependent receptor [Flavobacterium sp. CF108]